MTMDIDIRCEQCGEYLETVKEYTDRDGLKATVNPCSECIDYWKKNNELLEVLKAIPQLGEPLQPKYYVMINQAIEKAEGIL